MPSPAAISGADPSSARVIIWPPGETVTVTGPFGWSHLMFNADKVIGTPAVPAMTSFSGARRDPTTEFVHVNDPKALSRFPEMVEDILEIVSPPLKIRFLMARQSR